MPDSEKRVCPTCEGAGFLYDEESFTRIPCNCKIAEYMVKHLGPEIARAPTIYSSPLYEFGAKSGDLPKVDRTKENLYIKCAWVDLLSHLKLCLWPQGIFFNFRVVTDEEIKTVFVGAMAYNQRAKSKRDDMVTYNSLNDLLGKEWDFIIIRLGHLGHKNAAAAGAIKEALMIRDTDQKVTWLIEEPNSPFGHGNFSYSDELAEYIDQNFKRIALVREDDDRVFDQRGYRGAEEIEGGVEDVTPDEPLVRARVKYEPPESAIPTDEELVLPGSGRSSGSKWKGKYKPKGGGGGPI
jgi:hypothetical protein